MIMLPETIEQALIRTEEHLLETDDAEAIIARRESERASSGDGDRAAALAADLVDRQGEDGSWNGDLVETADALIRLRELADVGARIESGDALSRGIVWLRGRQQAPGRFAEGCSPDRHRVGLCHHLMTGFFSPGRPNALPLPVRLPPGIEIDDDGRARLAASCIALQAILRWNRRTTDTKLHIYGLERIISLWDRWDDERFGPAVGLVLLSTLLEAPDTPDTRAAADHGLRLLLRNQRADGSWREADTFQAADVLTRAVRGPHRSEALDAAVDRAAALLAATQGPDGTWGTEAPPRRTLIGWRILRTSVRAAERSAAGSA